MTAQSRNRKRIRIALAVAITATWWLPSIVSAQEQQGQNQTSAQSDVTDNINQEGQENKVQLPMDPDTIVFQLKFSGGFRRAPADGFEPTPRLRVFADGRIITGQNAPDLPVYEIQLNDSQLVELLSEVTGTLDFFSIDQDLIAREIANSGRPVLIADAPNSEITVQLKDRQHAVSAYAVNYVASSYPEIESLQRLQKVEALATRWCSIAQLGGVEIAQSIVDFANTKLSDESAGFTVSMANIHYAVQEPDESTSVQFRVENLDRIGEKSEIQSWSVHVQTDSDKKPKSIKITPFPIQQPRR